MDDDVIETDKVQTKKLNPQRPQKPVIGRGFIEMNESEEDDIQPIIVGEDFGVSGKSEQERRQILKKSEQEK